MGSPYWYQRNGMTFWHFDTFWGFKTAPVWSHRHWLSDCRYNPKGVAMVCYGWWMLAVWLVFSTVPKRPWEPLPLGQVGHLTAAWTDSDQGLRKFHTEVLRKKTKACRRYEGNYMILHVITRSVVFWLVHPISVLIRNSCFAYFFCMFHFTNGMMTQFTHILQGVAQQTTSNNQVSSLVSEPLHLVLKPQ